MVMIQALRFEPFGQRQRVESREPQEQDRHIHLHIHLNLTFRARQKGSLPTPNATRITRIVAALVGATVLPLWLLGASAMESMTLTLALIGALFLVGLAIGGVGCLALLIANLRATPRGGILLLVLFLIMPLLLPNLVLVFPLGILQNFSSLLLWLMLYGHPLISAILLAYVSRQVRALGQTATAHNKLSFVVVGGMMLMVLGGLLLNLFALLSAGPPLQLVLYLPAMCGAVIIAMYTLFGVFRQCKSTRAHPKDASPFSVDSSGESREDRA
jgi:hypothetical protein